LDNPRNIQEAENEFGTNLFNPPNGWSSLSKPLEFAIAAGPIVLFKAKKLSAVHISRTTLSRVSYNIYKVVFTKI
jgi:hypothetical protein